MPDKETVYAAEGTAAHTLSEWCRRYDRPAKHYRGRVIKEKGFEFVVDQEMIDGVQEFVDLCNEIDGDAFYEMRVHYDAYVPKGFGTSDDIRIRDYFCCVTDLKYGKGVQVFAKNDEQLMLYALGVYEEMKHLYEFDKFLLRICQPRLGHFDEFEITLEELLAWVERVVKPALKKSHFAAGKHCMFCKIKYSCTTRAKWAMQQMAGSTDDFENLDEALDAPIADPQLMGPDDVARCLEVLDSVTAWAKDVKAHAMRELQQGRELGGWKLVAGRSRRAWTVPEAVVVEELEDCEVDPYEHKLLTPPKAEKLLGKKHVLMALPEDGGIVRKGPGKPKLAAADDKRPAIAIDALSEFENLDDEESDDDY